MFNEEQILTQGITNGEILLLIIIMYIFIRFGEFLFVKIIEEIYFKKDDRKKI